MTGSARNLASGEPVHPESFSAMVIADLIAELPEHDALVNEVCAMLWDELGSENIFYFFKEHHRLPADADCTALGLSVLCNAEKFANDARKRALQALDRIVANTNHAGVVETYFDPSGERSGVVDAVVCCNALYLAHQMQRANEMQASLDYVHRVLVDESYLEGTRYYPSPETFLYFLGRLLHAFPEIQHRFVEPLRFALRQRLRTSADPIDLAQRVLLCAWFAVDDQGDAQHLFELRQSDGTWPIDSLFRYGRRNIYFGSQALATAFATAALANYQRVAEEPHASIDPFRASRCPVVQSPLMPGLRA
jgi:hypothetical protein